MGLDTVLALRPWADISLKYLRGSNGRCEGHYITGRTVGRTKQVFPVNAALDQDPEEVLVHVVFQCSVFHKLCSSLEEPDRCGPRLSG